MARIELERDRLDEAETYLNTGLRIARPGGFGEVERTGRYLRAHLAAARGDLVAVTDIFQNSERIVNALDDPYLTGELNREWCQCAPYNVPGSCTNDGSPAIYVKRLV
jgi:hypothetical protein